MRHVAGGGAVPIRPACVRTVPDCLQQNLPVFVRLSCSLITLMTLLIVVLAPPIQAALHLMFQAMENTKGSSATVPDPPARVADTGTGSVRRARSE